MGADRAKVAAQHYGKQEAVDDRVSELGQHEALSAPAPRPLMSAR